MFYQFFYSKIAPTVALSALGYLFFSVWHSWIFGSIVLVLYFLFVSAGTQKVLINYFDFVKSFQTRVLAIFFSLVTFGWFLGFFIFLNYFNGLSVFLAFFLNALVWSLVKANNITSLENKIEDKDEISPLSWYEKVGVLFYFLLIIYGFYLLIKSKTGGAIYSPWQAIDSSYVWVFLLVIFLSGMLILFSKFSLKILLFFVIANSFLLHSYLPLTHELFYGADGWRHMATEQRLMDGKQFLQVELAGSNNRASRQSLISNLQAKVGVLSYANFWGTNVIIGKILQVNLISLTKWFLPILWSIIFTILLYEIGLALGWSAKNSLLLAWGGMWPFALQAGGSFSLPVNFGFLIFILFVLLFLKKFRQPNIKQKNILLALGFGSAFGYLLFFILYWLGWGITAILKNGKKIIIIPGLIFASAALPILELAGKFSFIDRKINILTQIKQFVGNIFAVYLASGPRPHDIAGGNILFNQVTLSIFTPNFLTQFRWWLPVLVLATFIIVILGVKKNLKDLNYQFILAFATVLFVGYFLSFYLLTGEHLFSRRLDTVLACLFLILLFYGLSNFFDKKYIAGLTVIVLSLAITASYTLGPDTFTVKSNELEAMNYVWSKEEIYNTHCVLADVYPLLALEAVSKKEIVGGGFPIDANFAQPERVKLYEQMKLTINDNLLRTTATLTKTDHCWLVGETGNFYRQGVLNYGDYKIFGDVAAVRYNTKY
ncbi:MAG TPA: hypothetical protein VLK22_00700 [Candidatus Udaeobacter sp.]|nr:hypothetical protein [Candidatus Udaeobacter sp.]